MMLIIVFYLIEIIGCCVIAGQASGTCLRRPLNASSFCHQEISQYVCVQAHNKTWSEYDATYRDGIIQYIFLTNIQRRLLAEYNKMSSTFILANNPQCYKAYKTFTCQWNFPTCNHQNISLSMCLSVCQAYYSKCLGESDKCTIILKDIDIGIDQNC